MNPQAERAQKNVRCEKTNAGANNVPALHANDSIVAGACSKASLCANDSIVVSAAQQASHRAEQKFRKRMPQNAGELQTHGGA